MKNTKWFFFNFWDIWPYAQKPFFLFFLICFFCILESRKPGISIPDFVFYDIKILPDINKKDIKTTRKIIKCWNKYFWFFFNGPGQAQLHAWTVPCEQFHGIQMGWLLCISTVTSPSLFAHVGRGGATGWRTCGGVEAVLLAAEARGPAVFLLSLSSVFVLFSADSLSSSFFCFFFLFLSSLYPLSCNPSPSPSPLSFFSSLPLFL